MCQFNIEKIALWTLLNITLCSIRNYFISIYLVTCPMFVEWSFHILTVFCFPWVSRMIHAICIGQWSYAWTQIILLFDTDWIRLVQNENCGIEICEFQNLEFKLWMTIPPGWCKGEKLAKNAINLAFPSQWCSMICIPFLRIKFCNCRLFLVE